MKNKLLSLLLFFTIIVNSQVSDIANLTSGTLEKFSIVKDLDNTVYGYLTIYWLEKVSKTEDKYEYILLDKNLNKVSNGFFIDADYKRFNGYFFKPIKVKNEIIISKKHEYLGPAVQTEFNQSPYKFTFTSHRVLDLETNKISKPFYYQDGDLIEGERDVKKIKSIVKKQKVYDFPIPFSEGFFMFEKVKDKNKNLKKVKSLRAFDFDKKLKWTYDYNPNNEELNCIFNILDEKNVFLEVFNLKTRESVFHSLDPKTGKLLFKYKLSDKKSEYSYYCTIEALEDRFVVIGKFSPFKSKTGYNHEKAKGFFRIEIDKQGNELSKKYVFWEDLAPVIKIKGNGKVEEDKYRLSSKRFFVFKDGRISIINEKRKVGKNIFLGENVKTTDFVILNFDVDFNIKTVDTIEKEKSKWTYSDYLYSQEIDYGKGIAFFYADYKESAKGKKAKKNWVLGIVTIKEGKVSNEQIPMSSDDHFLYPYKAKEGYILLRELNKDDEHDQIRLERLNY